MKNKKVVIFLASLIVLIGGIFLVNNIYQNKNKINKTKRKRQNNIAIMIKEDGATDYTRASSKDIPKGNYTLNYEKSYCKNNGVIGDYDSTLGKVSFSFIGTDDCYLYFDYYIDPGYITILKNNGGKDAIEAKGTPDFTKVATENEGMYAAQDDLGTSYYFRGAVNNNWVKFGKTIHGNINYSDATLRDTLWRIIRINGDGSIRMIYSGAGDPSAYTSVVESNGAIMTESTASAVFFGGGNSFNENHSNFAHVGYMYTEDELHGTSTDSTIKSSLDLWYKNSSLETDPATKKLVADQIFCNDRSVVKTNDSGSHYIYGALARLDSNIKVGEKKPILTCPTDSDKFTVNASNGNGALTYPVGLITADEAVMAGGNAGSGMTGYGLQNSSYYLYTGTGQRYCTGSPSDFNFFDSNVGNIYYVDSAVTSINLEGDCFYRPVISLTADVKLIGDGTYTNPYRVS